MNRRWLLSLCLVFCWTSHSAAQNWEYRWEKGQQFRCKVKHVTDVFEIVDGKKSESSSKLDLVKLWKVIDRDEKGIATLELTLLTMRNEQKRANGEIMLFDSEDLAKSTPELRDMKKHLGTPLAILRMDQFGRVHEAKLGSTARYEAEPPFVIVFPNAKAAVGQAWRRQYTIVMEPPHGTGEKFDAEQVYTCKSIEAGKALLTVVTQFKTQPDNMVDRLPLLQKDMQGEIAFDLTMGRPTSIRLGIDKTIENHHGKGSSYRFQSQYSEVLLSE